MTHTAWNSRVALLSSIVENADDIISFSTPPVLINENTLGTDGFPDAVEYIIITRDSWKDGWQPLVDWNIKRGLYTEVVTVEEIRAGAGGLWATGEDWLETIRNCIRWYHEERGAQYFLLGTDSSDYEKSVPYFSEVPMRYSKIYSQLTGDGLDIRCFTDWYYACIDARFDWQTNGNSPWGEYYPPDHPSTNDFMDLVPDVSVGRIPVHSSSEANDAAMLSVNYQKHNYSGSSPSSDLLVVSAAAEMAGYPETWQHMQEIISVVPLSIDVKWLAERGCLIPFTDEITPDDVLDHLDGTAGGGGYYRVNFGGHGGTNWIGANPVGLPTEEWKVWSSDLRGLSGSDGKFCTGYAFNCLTGRFVTSGSNQNIVETWLGADDQIVNAPLGPVYVGNTNGGKNAVTFGGSSSHKLNRWFLDALYNQIPSEGVRGAGDVMNAASVTFAGEYLVGYPFVIPPPLQPGNIIYEPMWDLKELNLGGDPALPLWIQAPVQMVSMYPPQFHCPDDFTVQIQTSSGIAVSGVRVCLMMESANGFEVYIRGFTDSYGEFSAYLDPSFSGRMYVTLTKQDYLPDEGEVYLIVD